MTGNTVYRVGLVGAGYVSAYHIAALRRLEPLVRIVGITDLDTERAKATGLTVYPTLHSMVAAGLDAVHILTPPHTHAALTLEALASGLHVLVEKPLATSVEDCDRIATAAKAANRTVCVNHSLLCDPFIEHARTLVKQGALGDILSVDYFRSSDYPPYPGGPLPPQYREGGYPFRDLGVHALYLLQAFLGDLEDVQAQFRSAGKLSSDPNIAFDEWRALVRCRKGMGHIQLSWNVKPIQNQLFLQGTRGTLRVDMFSMFLALRKNTPLPKSIERAVNAINEGRSISTQVVGNAVRFLRGKLMSYHGLQLFVAEFYERIAKQEPPLVSLEQARQVVDWTERAARPADEAKQKFLARFPTKLTAPVLLTGGGGFIGRHLLKRLLTEYDRVRVFVRREPSAEIMNDPRIEIVLGDLGDPQAVARAVAGTQIVYHLGAAMSGSREDFERGTVVGTRNLIDNVLKNPGAKLVYVSSLSVLHAAAAKRGVMMKEDWPLEPRADERGAYTQTKLAAEKLVREAVAQRGLSAVILRPGQVFGPGAPLLTGAVARRAKGRLIILGNGELELPLVYVEDVVDAIVLAGKKGPMDGSIFHIVDNAHVTQRELARRAGGPGPKIVTIPFPIVYTLGFGVEMLGKLLKRSVPLSRYRLKSALAPISFDCSLAEKGLGWKPRIGVEKGLCLTLAEP